MGMEVTVVYFKVIFRHSRGGTDNNHGKLPINDVHDKIRTELL
jgi:hypothetical protein